MTDPPNDQSTPDTAPEEEVGASDTDGSPSTGQDADDHVEQSSGESESSDDSTIGLPEAQNRAREAADDLLEHEFEGVIKVDDTDEGWRTVVEVVERDAVPDTQDILGRYEITLDRSGTITGYELLKRYRRGELKEEL